MLVERIRIGASTVAVAARLGLVVVVVCGLVGVTAGVVRVTRTGELTEGVVVVLASTMTTVVSVVLLLFIAWCVDVATTADPSGARGEPGDVAGPRQERNDERRRTGWRSRAPQPPDASADRPRGPQSSLGRPDDPGVAGPVVERTGG